MHTESLTPDIVDDYEASIASLAPIHSEPRPTAPTTIISFKDFLHAHADFLTSVNLSPEELKNITTPFYYLPSNNDYFFDYGHEIRKSTLRALNIYLERMGLTKVKIQNLNISLQHLAETYIITHKYCDYAGPLSGKQKGLHTITGRRFLATTSPQIIEPKQGKYPVISEILDSILKHDNYADKQLITLLGWLRHAYTCLKHQSPQPGQSLFLAGDTASGKTFLIKRIILPLLGGRSTSPYNYMMGLTSFNGDMMASEALIMDDCIGSTDYKSKRIFATHLKNLIYAGLIRFEFKNKDAFTHIPLWRLIVALNDTEESLSIIPPIDNDLKDKVIILSCGAMKTTLPNTTPEERTTLDQTIHDELPHFLYALLNLEEEIFEPHKKTREAARSGIDAFHHPDIIAKITELSPELALLDIIDNYMSNNNYIALSNRSTIEIEQFLSTTNSKRLDKLCPHANSLGILLRKLSESHPSRVTKTAENKGGKGRSRWNIQPQPYAERTEPQPDIPF